MRDVSLQLGPDVAKHDAEHYLQRLVVHGDVSVVVPRGLFKHLVDLIAVHRVTEVMLPTGDVERVLPLNRVVNRKVAGAEHFVEQVC